MSTNSPKIYRSVKDLSEAQFNINPEPRYWTWFEQWWAQDFSWDGLAKGQWNDSPDTSINLQEYWSEYVKKDDLVTFGQNDDSTSRRWTIFHLPPHDREGIKSPKHDMYQGDGAWKNGVSNSLQLTGPKVEFDKVISRILEYSTPVLPHVNQDGRARLDGIFFPTFYSRNSENGEPIYVICNWSCLNFNCLFMTEHDKIPKSNSDLLTYDADTHYFTIGGKSSFDNSCFMSSIFNNGKVESDVSFDGALFLSYAIFSYTKFGGDVSFENCQFCSLTWFRCTSSSSSIDRLAPTYFRNAHFFSDAIFTNRQFEDGTDFSGVTFGGLVKFQGCKFHQDTSFADTQHYIPPKTPNWLYRFRRWVRRNPIDIEQYAKTAEVAQRSFRTLRQLMEMNHATTEAFRFARLEQISRERRVPPFKWPWPFGLYRHVDVPLWERFSSRIYGGLVDYGQNALFPLLWLFFIYSEASFSYYFLAGEWANPGAAMATAFQYSLPPVSTFAAQFFAGEVDQAFTNALLDHPFLTRFVMVAHGVTSLALVFFLLLALKRRFQIR